MIKSSFINLSLSVFPPLMQQQTLNLKLSHTKTFDHFVGAAHAPVIHALQSVDLSNIYLWGVRGCGISHLLQATCHYWQCQGGYTLFVDLKQKPSLEVLLDGAIEGIQLVAIDHLEIALGEKNQEEKLFHLFNRGVQTSFKIILGAHTAPRQLKCTLPDLASRLHACTIFHIASLTDEEKQIVLQLHAKQRGFELTPEVAQFLLTHFSRQLQVLLNLLDKLDQASLQTHRRLTIPFLKKYL